jgi:hypothetical protein
MIRMLIKDLRKIILEYVKAQRKGFKDEQSAGLPVLVFIVPFSHSTEDLVYIVPNSKLKKERGIRPRRTWPGRKSGACYVVRKKAECWCLDSN